MIVRARAWPPVHLCELEKKVFDVPRRRVAWCEDCAFSMTGQARKPPI
jgi:hypothetical protein